jgi:di/tricarboxylate transporter
MLVYRAAPVSWESWFTLAVVLLALVAMAREIAGPDLIMMGALFALAGVGVLTPEETFRGFANPALAAIGALFVVSAGLRDTGALEMTVGRWVAPARGESSGLARICPPVAGLSAFLNNAPIVAMMTPTIIDWARRRGLSPSRFLIPLSYSSILGSGTTVIGTSTNLTVAGLMVAAGMTPMGFFELAPVGLPLAIAGLVYLQFAGPRFPAASPPRSSSEIASVPSCRSTPTIRASRPRSTVSVSSNRNGVDLIGYFSTVLRSESSIASECPSARMRSALGGA